MQSRHRIPTIFSIYMVDVLCCALGCVVLMWQYNLNEAEEKTAEAKENATVAEKNAAEVKRQYEAWLAASSSLDSKNSLLAKLMNEKNKLAKDLDTLTLDSGRLAALLAERDKEKSTLTTELEQKSAHFALLRVKLDESALQNAQLAKLMVVLEKDYEEARAARALLQSKFDLRSQEVTDLKKTKEINLAELARRAQDIADLEKRITDGNLELTGLKIALEKARKDAREAGIKIDDTKLSLEDAVKLNRSLAKQIEKLEADLKKTKEVNLADLAKKAQEIVDLEKKINDGNLELAGLKIALEKARKDAREAGIKIDDTKLSLEDALKLNRKIEADLRQSKADHEESKFRFKLLEQENLRNRTELAEMKDRYKDLAKLSTKELQQAQELAAKLKQENVTLVTKVQSIQKTFEKRFAGITLTGNRVIFLVDMSGSMEFVEEERLDPDKWPLVCETVGKVMMSLPDLKQYQVIMFANNVSYPLGGQDRWHDFNGQATVDFTVKQLKAIKPKGGTNIHAAFAEVFKYRKLGLDTVYFFSDGLPTSGEPLTADGKTKEGRVLNEREKNDILSAHVRMKLKKMWNAPIPSNPRVRINTIGFFYESPDVGSFLWALAREHDGSFVGMSKP